MGGAATIEKFFARQNRGFRNGLLGIPMTLSGQKLAPQEPESKVRQLELLLDLTGAISRAQGPSEIYRAAAQGLVGALIADRSAVLICDQDDVMRFKEWVGLSDKHRAAVESHITWQQGARDALPITVSDSMQDASLSAFWEVFAQEGIRALAFIPLIANSVRRPDFDLESKVAEFVRSYIRASTDELNIPRSGHPHGLFGVFRHRRSSAPYRRVSPRSVPDRLHEHPARSNECLRWCQLCERWLRSPVEPGPASPIGERSRCGSFRGQARACCAQMLRRPQAYYRRALEGRN